MPQVTMPDGTLVNMPDQLDPALGTRLRAFQANGGKPPAPKDYDAWPADKAPPDGFHVITTNGSPYIVHDFGAGDVVKALGDVPGVGMAERIGQGATRLAGKAASGIAGLFGGQSAVDNVQNTVNKATELPESNDPLVQASNAAGAAASHVAAPVDRAVGNLPPALRTGIETTEEAIPDLASLLPGGQAAAEARAASAVPKIAKTGAEVAGEAGYTGLRTKADLASPGAQGITDKLIGADAGLTADQSPSVANLENARKTGPGKVYDQTHAALPDQLTQDPQLQTDLKNLPQQVSQLPRSPDVQALQEVMLNQPNMTKDELFANISEARERAKANWKSDDPDKNSLGDAYSRVADAYENFVGRQPGVNLPQWQQARVQMAKNYLAQGALRGEHFNAQAFGRVAEQNPHLLTGNAAIVGQTANSLPAGAAPGVTSSLAPAAGGALAGEVAGQHFGVPGVGAIAGTMAGPVARAAIERFMTRGNPAAAGGTASNPALSYFFDHPAAAPAEEPPLPPGIAGLLPAPPMVNAGGGATTPNILEALGLTPDVQAAGAAHPGAPREASPAAAPPERGPMPSVEMRGPQNWSPLAPGASPAPNAEDAWFTGDRGSPVGNRFAPTPDRGQGGISLADLLSEGLEQRPAEGLTAGPMGIPAREGIPFRQNAEHMAGGLSLADEFSPGAAENNSDVAGVRSQGVPEDIAARAESRSVPTAHAVEHAADETGVHTVTSPNGESTAVESGPYLVEKRTDTSEAAQGKGEGLARLLRLGQAAQEAGKTLASDVSVSPAAMRMWRSLSKEGYTVKVNPNATRASTGNYVSDDPRRPVITAVKSPSLAEALGGF